MKEFLDDLKEVFEKRMEEEYFRGFNCGKTVGEEETIKKLKKDIESDVYDRGYADGKIHCSFDEHKRIRRETINEVFNLILNNLVDYYEGCENMIDKDGLIELKNELLEKVI